MRTLLLMLLSCTPAIPAFAMSCAENVRVGQWYAKKAITPELLDALVGRRLEIADVRETFDGLLIAAGRDDENIVLRVLTSEDVIEDLTFSAGARRGYPRLTVGGEVPDLIRERDAKHGDRSVRIRPGVNLFKLLRDKVRPGRPVRLIYVESHARSLREVTGLIDLPGEDEQLTASLTGKRSALHVRTAGGTLTVEPRRVLRVYL